jgi:hypothetical protein
LAEGQNQLIDKIPIWRMGYIGQLKSHWTDEYQNRGSNIHIFKEHYIVCFDAQFQATSSTMPSLFWIPLG